MDFGTTSAQPAAYVCQEPHTAARLMAGNGKIVSRIRAGQAALSLLIAEGVGFEPTVTRQRHSGFQDRRHRPLGEPSWCRVQPLTSRTAECWPDFALTARGRPRLSDRGENLDLGLRGRVGPGPATRGGLAAGACAMAETGSGAGGRRCRRFFHKCS